jgi:hypothetical protein
VASPAPTHGSSAHEKVRLLRARLAEIAPAATAGRIRIIAVSKTHGPERIRELWNAGISDFGENRQNEARDKFPLVPVDDLPVDARPVYHHIGPLQSGSARQIPGLFDWVHGVASMDALSRLMEAAPRKSPDRPLHYLIQVRLTAERSKAGGMEPDQLRQMNHFPGNELVRFAGFMTIGPANQDPVETREVFHQLRELRDLLAPGTELSMGMSGDWEIAVAEGATMIRIGTALFGPRGPGPWRP